MMYVQLRELSLELSALSAVRDCAEHYTGVADDIIQLRRQGVKMHQPETYFTTSPSATAADAAAEEASTAG